MAITDEQLHHLKEKIKDLGKFYLEDIRDAVKQLSKDFDVKIIVPKKINFIVYKKPDRRNNDGTEV